MSTPALFDTDTSGRDGWGWDWTLSVLAPKQRRHLLAALADSGGEADLSELSRQLLVQTDSMPTETVPEDLIDRMAIGLYHTHVPKLVDEGVLDWSDDRSRVALTEQALSHPILLPLARWSRCPASLAVSEQTVW
jgi:hypothetical protein